MSNWIRLNDNSLVCHVADEAETDLVGHQIALALNAGDVVALIGGLGATFAVGDCFWPCKSWDCGCPATS